MTTTMGVVAMGGVGILGVAWIATLALRRASASLRHSIWLAALCATVALPVFEWTGVDVAVRVPEALALDLESTRSGVGSMPFVPMPGLEERAGAGAALAPAGMANESTTGRAAASSPAAAQDPLLAPARTGGASSEGRASRVGEAAGAELASRAVSSAIGRLGAFLPGLVWLAGAALLLCVTLSAQLRARRVTIRQTRPASRDAQARLEVGVERLGIRRAVRLVVSPHIAVPATWGIVRPTIVLPEEYADWSGPTLDRVLLHELAHVRRADCAAYLVGEVTRALHWFNPLAWIAVRRLRAESERASDDRVLDLVDAPSDYAGDLVSMLRALRGRPVPSGALLAMAQSSGVTDRVRAILDPRQSRRRVGAPAATAIASVALLLVVSATMVTPVAAGPEAADAAGSSPTQERICVFREGGSRSTSINIDDDEVRIRWETDDCRVEIEMEGDVEFSADDRRIVALGADAVFEVEERMGRDGRRARIEGLPGGGMERRYWDDGDETPWGAEADRWLAALLPELFRHSTINAEARVRRMVDEGGPDRVFQEVERIQSDHVARRYLELLMDATQLSEAEYGRVIDAAGSIDSDHGSAELLLAVVERAGLHPAFQDPMLAASERLDSDHQRTRVLQALLDSPLSDRQLDAVLRSARSIDSDHNLGELLSSIARQGRLDDAGRASFLETLRSVDSDHQQAMVVHAFLDSGRLSDAELAGVLEMMDDIESDHQRADVLQRVAREYQLSGAQVTAYLRSASRMASDHQKAATAIAVIERTDFDSDHLSLVLRLTDDVDSDHQRVQILQRVVERRELAPVELSELLTVAADTDSDHQLSMLLGRILEEQELAEEQLVDVLRAARGVESDHQRSTLLLRIARDHELGPDARAEYMALADDLGRRDRERVLAAIAR